MLAYLSHQSSSYRTDVNLRYTFWTLLIGGSCFFIADSCSQTSFQRLLSLPDVKAARKAALLYVLGLTFLMALFLYGGILLLATYRDCDPMKTEMIKANDQLLPLLVVRTLRDTPGSLGLFTAVLISSSVFSITSCLKSLTSFTRENSFKMQIPERWQAFILFATVVTSGILTVSLVHLVENLSTIIQLSISVIGSCLGSVLGVVLIGLLMPWIGRRATFFGALIGLIIILYCLFKAQSEVAEGMLSYDMRSTTTDGCNFNLTLVPSKEMPTMEQQFYHISYLYHCPLGALLTCFWSFILSFFFGFEDAGKVDSRLLAPFMRKHFKSRILHSVDGKDSKAIIVSFEMRENQLQ